MVSGRKKFFLLKKNFKNIRSFTENVQAEESPRKSIFWEVTKENDVFDAFEDKTNKSKEWSPEPKRKFSTISESKSFCESMLTPERTVIDIDNPEKRIIMPIITDTKYKFSMCLPKINRKVVSDSEPVYKIQMADLGKRNIARMKKYKRIWEHQA